MKHMNIKPAFRYCIFDLLRNSGVFYIIMLFVTAAFSVMAILQNGDTVSGSYSAFAVAGSIMLFVTGITTIREDLRLFIQHGVSRRTTFWANLLSAVAVCAVLAAAGELMIAAAQALTAGNSRILISDLYHFVYADISIRQLSFLQHIESVFFNFSIFLFAYMIGMFISLMFFRLSKAWTVVVGVGAPSFIFIGLPLIINFVPPVPWVIAALKAFGEWLLSGVWSWFLFFVLLALFFAAISWLLTHRAPINEAGK